MGTNGDRVVVLGIGNILLRDEGVGVRVVDEFQRQYTVPDNVQVVDGGTQGLGLMPTIQEADRLIVVDAILSGEEAGTLYRLEKRDLPKDIRPRMSTSDCDFVDALNLCDLLGCGPESVVVLGIEPQDITRFGLGMTEKVAAKVPNLVLQVVQELRKLGIELERKRCSKRD